MKETTSYGGYHDILSGTSQIEFHENPKSFDLADLPTNKALNNVRHSKEPVTDDFLERLGGAITIDSEMIETSVFNSIEIEDKPDVETTF